MTPFLSRGARTYKGRAYDRAGQRHVRSLGTRDAAEAARFEAFLDRLRANRRWDTLDLIIAGELAVATAFDADASGTLAAVVLEAQRRQAQAAALAADVDLDPLVTEWNGQGRRARSDKYLAQVRRMIASGTRFPVSQFRRKRLSEFLSRLPVDRATKNRYRQALLQFGNWLVEREVLESNPVRDVKGFGENDPNLRKYERDEARRIIEQLAYPYRALEAMMAGSAMEWQAVERVRRQDVDLEARTIFADGGKNRWRKRTVVVTEPWCWDLVEAYIREWDEESDDAAGTERLFAGVDHKVALAKHHAACAAAGVHDSGLHDWRDSYAYWNLWLDGMAPAYLRPQFGHAPNSTTLERSYAAWVPTPLQRRERSERAQNRTPLDKSGRNTKVTKPATSPRKRVR